jgi:soluble lytic murein transglycosylase-like protein
MHGLRVTAALLCLTGSQNAFAEPDLFSFVDTQGQVHLSNVPDDIRYRAIDPGFLRESARRREEPAAVVEPRQRRPYAALVAQVAARLGIEAALLHAVILVESGYNPKAISKKGAAGLMQLMPATARRYGVTDVFNPADNVRAGGEYLIDLLKLFDNDLHLALAAYNAGESAVIRHGMRVPPYPETVAYVPRVVDFYRKLKSPL